MRNSTRTASEMWFIIEICHHLWQFTAQLVNNNERSNRLYRLISKDFGIKLFMLDCFRIEYIYEIINLDLK